MKTEQEDNVVVMFKTFEELQRDEEAIVARYEAEWRKAFEDFELAKAAIASQEADLDELKKANAAADAAIAKASALEKGEALGKQILGMLNSINKRSEIDDAKRDAVRTLFDAQKSIKARYEAALYGSSQLAKRSRRFASVQDRPHFGPGASLLNFEAKR